METMKPTKANTGLYTGGWLDLKLRVADPGGVDPDPTLRINPDSLIINLSFLIGDCFSTMDGMSLFIFNLAIPTKRNITLIFAQLSFDQGCRSGFGCFLKLGSRFGF